MQYEIINFFVYPNGSWLLLSTATNCHTGKLYYNQTGFSFASKAAAMLLVQEHLVSL